MRVDITKIAYVLDFCVLVTILIIFFRLITSSDDEEVKSINFGDNVDELDESLEPRLTFSDLKRRKIACDSHGKERYQSRYYEKCSNL